MRKGTLITTSLSNSKNLSNNDVKLFIVRSCKNRDYIEKLGWQVVPELSPDTSLFYKYLELKNMGQWNNETFKSIYTPEFKRQMKCRLDMRNALDVLQEVLNSGSDVVIGCYCKDLCHRNIIGDYFEDLGYKVERN